MAKSSFKIVETKTISIDDAKKSAQEKDARTANFHISADTDEIITFTGNFLESVWERYENGKVVSDGTMLLIECVRSDKKTIIKIPFGFLRTKELVQEDGIKKFEGAFDKNATFENIVTTLKKNDKFQVKRDSYIYPGRSSARDIDTLVYSR